MSLVLALWLAVAALADEPTPRPESGADREVVVERRLDAARDEVIRAAKDAGYRRQRRKKDRTILRHDDPWKGEFVLYDDGRVSFVRQPVRFEPPGGARNPASYLMCVLFPLCIRPGGQTAAKHLFRAAERRALEAVHPQIQAFQEKIGDEAVDRRIDALPDKLERLWNDGIPLDPGPVLVTPEERRLAIFDYWNTRTETEWGEAVRDAVENFVFAIVQTSPSPYAEAELARLNGGRAVQRIFLAPPDPEDGQEGVEP